MDIKGTYNIAQIFTDNVDETTFAQVEELCNQPFTEGEDIRIMPDCHAGAGCVIGTTMTLKGKKIVPNLVGVDIGCGVYITTVNTNNVDLEEFDKVIHSKIPSGFSVRSTPHPFSDFVNFGEVIAEVGDMKRHILSVGTLGGGNHFIELDKDEYDHIYLVIHSGSRNFGKQIAEYWQKKAIETCQEETPSALAYLTGELYDNYLHDMKIAQHFAKVNRIAMKETILRSFELHGYEGFETVHNYIDFNAGILRKGAVSAQKGEKLIIPMNMRDGSIIAIGKGNADWNMSAPHGAGRIMSRAKAKKEISLDEFKGSMEGIYSTTVNASTIDESPMAYKSMAEILGNIVDTVDIENVITPMYNFKNSQG